MEIEERSFVAALLWMTANCGWVSRTHFSNLASVKLQEQTSAVTAASSLRRAPREKHVSGETLSDEEFFVLGGGFGFGDAALVAAQHVQAYFYAFHYGGGLADRAPEGAAEFGAGFVDDFHRAG